jgi:hypothetical protein
MRSAFLWMMAVRRRSCSPSARGFAEELARVTHRADGIAYLVCDARGEPAERRQLLLLHALREEARIFEEDQRRRRTLASERRQVWRDQRRAVVRGKAERGRLRGRRVVAPGEHVGVQLRRELAERASDRAGAPRSAACRRIRS